MNPKNIRDYNCWYLQADTHYKTLYCSEEWSSISVKFKPISLHINHTPETIYENQIISTLIFVPDTLYIVSITENLDSRPTEMENNSWHRA